MDYLGGPDVITRVLRSGRQNRDGRVPAREGPGPALLASKRQGATSQGMWVASKAEKGRDQFPLEPPERNTALLTSGS